MLTAEASQGPPFFGSVKFSIKSADKMKLMFFHLCYFQYLVPRIIVSYRYLLPVGDSIYLCCFFTPSHILSLPLLPYLVCVCVCVLLYAKCLQSILRSPSDVWRCVKSSFADSGSSNPDLGFLVNPDPDPDTGFWRPKIEKSTGGKQILLFITKRQNRYLPLVLLRDCLSSPRKPLAFQIEHTALQNGKFFISFSFEDHVCRSGAVFRIRI
jgi:hypothetical protein